MNGKEIYVECKAQKDPVSAPVLRQLWGTVDCEEYSEGWIISTSEFTKDAKGFVENWKSKPKEKSERLSFYCPKVIVEALKSSSIISEPPVLAARSWLIPRKNWEIGLFYCLSMVCTGVYIP
ncbi:restriction endonuclease [Vibrio sp. PP-XX7]